MFFDEQRIFVDFDFAKLDSLPVVGCQIFQCRADSEAGETPFRPEIEQHHSVMFLHRVAEVFIGHLGHLRLRRFREFALLQKQDDVPDVVHRLRIVEGRHQRDALGCVLLPRFGDDRVGVKDRLEDFVGAKAAADVGHVGAHGQFVAHARGFLVADGVAMPTAVGVKGVVPAFHGELLLGGVFRRLERVGGCRLRSRLDRRGVGWFAAPVEQRAQGK